MRILQIITVGHVFYGAQKHVLQLSERLIADGHDVLVLCGTCGILTERLQAAGVGVRAVPTMEHPIRPLEDLRAIRALRRAIREFRPDVVATHSSKAGIVGRVAAWTCRVPCVFTAHGWSFADGVPRRQRAVALVCERLCGAISNRIIAVARSERDLGVAQRVASPERIVCIYYGVDDRAGGRLARAGRAPPVRLVMIAGFRPQKDHATLLHALARLAHRDWHLTLLGDGPLLDDVKALGARSGLGDRVTFAGAVSDVSGYLEDADVLVLITHWEGMPISTLEGMSFGLPVVATDVAGTKEQVVHGENGFLVPRGDVDAVAEALGRLLDDAELRRRCGERSRELYEAHFTIEAMYSRTLALYDEVGGGGERLSERTAAPAPEARRQM